MKIRKPEPLRAVQAIGVLLIACLHTGCISGLGDLTGALEQTNREIRNAVDSFDRAIDALARQSADWQVVLEELEEAMVEDVQSTIRVEVTNLLRTGVLGAGAEFRCDAEFLRLRTERELRRIRNELAQLLNAAGASPPIPLLPVPPTEPYICSVVPSAVDMSLDPERRPMLEVYGFDLRSLAITAEVIDSVGSRANVTGSLGIASDTQMVLDLTDAGANLNENDRQIAFSWDGAVQSVIRILSPGSQTPNCEMRTVLVTGDRQSFIPPHTGGDREFAGNGPCVLFTLDLEIDPLRTQLTATYFMDAYECSDAFDKLRYDYTRARGSGQLDLFQVSNPGDRILGHNLESFFSFQYIDDDRPEDVFTFGGTQPVEKLIFVGDTKGNEAGTETGVEIFFRDLRIEIEECRTD